MLLEPNVRAEWDFRECAELDTKLLRLVTIYEYTRECPWIEKAVSKWLDSKFPEPTDEDYLRNTPVGRIPDYLSNHKVREAINAAEHRFGNNLSRDILESVFDCSFEACDEAYEGGHPIVEAFCFLAQWPEPISLLRGSDCWETCEKIHNLSQKPYIKTIPKDSPVYLQNPKMWEQHFSEYNNCDHLWEVSQVNDNKSVIDRLNGRRIVSFSIDMTKKREELKKAFGQWLAFVGHKASPQIRSDYYTDRLKWLSAYRLHRLYKQRGIKIDHLLFDIRSVVKDSSLVDVLPDNSSINLDSSLDNAIASKVIPICESLTALNTMRGKAEKFLDDKIKIRAETKRTGGKICITHKDWRR
jgi:hypothetical protein